MLRLARVSLLAALVVGLCVVVTIAAGSGSSMGYPSRVQAVVVGAALAVWPTFVLREIAHVAAARSLGFRVEHVDVRTWRPTTVIAPPGPATERERALMNLAGGLVPVALAVVAGSVAVVSRDGLSRGAWGVVTAELVLIARTIDRSELTTWRRSDALPLSTVRRLVADGDPEKALAAADALLDSGRFRSAEHEEIRSIVTECVLLLAAEDRYDEVEAWLATFPGLHKRANLRIRLIAARGRTAEALAEADRLSAEVEANEPDSRAGRQWHILRHFRCELLFGMGDYAGALAAVDEQLSTDEFELSEGCRAELKNLGAYTIAALDDASRFGDADRWSESGLRDVEDHDPDDRFGRAARADTRGAVLAVLGRGFEARPLLSVGSRVAVEHGLPEHDIALNRLFLACAFAAMGDRAEAAEHLTAAAEAGVRAPLLDRVAAQIEEIREP